MEKKHFLILLFVFITALPLLAQQQLADSIETLLKKELPDSTRAVAMAFRGMYYETIDSAKSKQFYKEAIDYAVKRNLHYAAGLAIHFELYLDITKGKYEERLGDIEKAIYYLGLSDNKKAKLELSFVLSEKASMFYKKEMYDSAAIWYLKGIEVLEKEKRYDRAAGLYTNLASVYEILKLKDKQKEYILKGLEAARQSGKGYDLFGTYSMMSQYYFGIDDYKMSLLYSDSSRLYFTNEMGTARIHLYYLVRAQAFEGVGKFDSSVYYYKKAYDLKNDDKDKWGMTEPLLRIGYGYMKLGRKKEAEDFLLKGIKLAEENNFVVFKRTGYELLSKFYEESGDFKQSLTAYQKYSGANDSLQEENRKKAILDLDKKYETEKKEQQLKLQQVSIKEKNTLNYILGGSIAALLLISLLSYRTYQQKRKLQEQKITELEKEKQLLATRSIVKGQEEERSRLAKDLHDGLGGLLSGVKLQLGAMKGNLILSEENGRAFNNALGKLDESINEMRRVAHNMMPEALLKLGLQQALQDYCDGLSESLPFKINCEFHALENRMPSSSEIVVYRIVQELLNNAVKHSGATSILAQVIRQGDNLSITVEDDGKGFDISQTDMTKGAGLANVKTRVDYLKGQMDLQSTPGKGTSIHIECAAEG
jgi:signal transduction histidine kinase